MQDNSPLDFPSIINACWWAVVTLTSLGPGTLQISAMTKLQVVKCTVGPVLFTEGYGDLYPKTVQGKCVGTACQLQHGTVLSWQSEQVREHVALSIIKNHWKKAALEGMMAMIAGLLLIALPIAIISQKFQAGVGGMS